MNICCLWHKKNNQFLVVTETRLLVRKMVYEKLSYELAMYRHYETLLSSAKNTSNDITMSVCESKLSTLISIGQMSVINAK